MRLIDGLGARARVARVRSAFVSAPQTTTLKLPGISDAIPRRASALDAGVATHFERVSADRVYAAIPPTAPGATRPAVVDLPVRASGLVRIEDASSHVRVAFSLRGATDRSITTANGIALYARALDGADVLHRVLAHGTEDFFFFERRPAQEELRYDVDVSRVAGLRLVANTLEFLDASGTPRLRVAPPSIVDARGLRFPATLSVERCAFDTSPVAPWGRAVVAPGTPSCAMRVTWGNKTVNYPVLLDPAWTTTGSMAVAREFHSASVLGTGKVLVAGGRAGNTYQSTAELYDPASGTFAATGAMAGPRGYHLSAAYGSGTGIVLVAGGTDGASILSSSEIYNATTGAFATAGAMTTARYSARAAVLSTTANVLVTGGFTTGGVATASAEYFDVAQNTFSVIGPMGQARAYHAIVEIGPGKVLVTGGTPDAASLLQSAEIYQETLQAFSPIAPMTAPRARHSATLLGNGTVLVAGSWSSSTSVSLASAEIFDPSTATFTATGSMGTPRGHHVGRLSPVGTVLVAGGISNTTYTSTAEVYDPVAKTFTTIPSMISPRAFHTGLVMPNSKTIMIGGNDGNTALSSAEILAVPAGAACKASTDCMSGNCNDGICCSSAACSGTCTSCAPGTGACTTITAMTDPDTCTAPNWCNALGQCGPVPNPCLNDPCDPYCNSITTDAGAGGLSSPASAGGSFSATVGLGATPGGFANKELCQPCTGPFPTTCGSFTHYNSFDACESDYHCDTSSGTCVQSPAGWTWPSSVCSGVDLTVEASCNSGSQYVFPVCNRGNAAVAGGKTIAFYIVNGNQFSVNPNSCPTLASSCSYTLPSPLLPGTCQPVSTCAWAGNSIVYANADNAIAECPSPTGPGCGDNWADIKAGGGNCQSVGAYTPLQVTVQYIATCATGSHAQWGFLTYSSVVATNASGNSDTTFKAQTAPVRIDGSLGTFTAYKPLADAVATDPAVCQAPCLVDMFQKLGGAPTATNEVLNLQITVSPTPDGQASGTLQSYQLTYDCVPSQ